VRSTGSTTAGTLFLPERGKDCPPTLIVVLNSSNSKTKRRRNYLKSRKQKKERRCPLCTITGVGTCEGKKAKRQQSKRARIETEIFLNEK